jgi:hypothetical protein
MNCSSSIGCVVAYPLRLNVSADDTVPHYVFTIGFDLTIGLNMHVVESTPGNGTLHINITTVSAKAVIYDDAAIPVRIEGLQLKSGLICQLAKLLLNKELSTGIPLPLLGPIKLEGAQVTMDNGFIALASGLLLPPSEPAHLARTWPVEIR